MNDSDESLSGPAAGLLSMMDRIEASDDCRARRARIAAWMADAPSGALLDLGCGAGTAAIELALAHPERDTHGVDVNEGLLNVARARASRAGARCTFHERDALSLPFEDASAGAIRAERLFQHLAEPERALAEARRVLRPEGRLAVIDQDWDAAIVASDDLATTRALLRSFADGIRRPTLARAMRPLLRECGFHAVDVQPDARFSTSFAAHRWFVDLLADLGRILEPVPADTVDAWHREQLERAERDAFCVMIPWVISTAIKR